MNSTRKRKKAFYVQANSKKKKCGEAKSLDNGMKGFLVTTNGNEGKAVLEAYSLLNEYADQPQGEEEQEGTVDAADALEEELAALKHTSKDSHYRFKSVSSGARGVLFIMCSPEINPHGVVHNMFSDVLQQHKRKARFCVRFLPVVLVCPAFLDDIKRHIPGALKEFHDPDVGAIKFGVAIRCRNNSSVVKEEVVSAVADAVTQGGKLPHKVDLSAPDRMVIVEIIQSHCCISVVTDYFQFKKYNLQEAMTASTSSNQDPTSAPGNFPTAQVEHLAPQEAPSMTKVETSNTQEETCNAQGVLSGRQSEPCKMHSEPTEKSSIVQRDPSIMNAESSTTHAESSTTHAESSTTHAQSSTTDAQSSTTDAQSSTTDAQSSTTHVESSTTHAESSTTHAESSTTHAESSTTHVESSTTHVESSTTHGEPSAAQEASSTTHGSTYMTHEETGTTHGEPSTTHVEPPKMYEEP